MLALKAQAQIPIPSVGNWNPSPTSSVTLSNSGIGTLTPDGKFEVVLQSCFSNQNGLIVTDKFCSTLIINPGDFNDPGIVNVVPLGGGGGSLIVNYPSLIGWAFPTSPINLPLIATPSNKPLLWLRQEKTAGISSSTVTDYDTRLIVKPNGFMGINTANPRATFDVMNRGGGASSVTPTAVFSSIKSAGSVTIANPETNLPQSVNGLKTRSLLFFNNLRDKSYNKIVNENDQAIIFTDGAGINTDFTGANVDGALVIAPFDNNVNSPTSTIGGIRINKDGNVEVHGTLRATDMTVNAKWWSDFVFASNYNLMPLSQVNQYIKTNGYLPGMPSEKQVLDSGLNIGDMQALQQQKIEELTLYSIAQDEKLGLQTEALKAQEERLKALEAKLNTLTK